jgi:hypothetical protein
VKHSSGLGYD